MQKEDPLPDTPQWSRAELAARCVPLRDAIGQRPAHVVKLEVAVGEIGDVALVRVGRLPCGVLLDMARATAYVHKLLAAVGDRRRVLDRCRRCAQPGKGREIYDVRGIVRGRAVARPAVVQISEIFW